MAENNDEIHIQRCLKLIVDQLNWGDPSEWTNYDFSKLSDLVHQRTQVRLSVTTLKRMWGRLKYESAPALTTLNALAQFAGFVDWREFCRDTPAVTSPQVTSSPPPKTQQKFNSRWMIAAMVLIVPVAWFMISFTKKPSVDPDQFSFAANKMIAEGVPNSVVFSYDATAAATDSVYIVQTWDIRRKTLVSATGHEHSAIYYYPGFFRTKLIVDGVVARTHDLFVTSDGWLGLIEQDPIPIYLKKDEFTFSDRIEVNEQLLSSYNLSLQPEPPSLRFFNQRDLGDITNDNFQFETKLKTDFKDGAGACQFVQVLIQCKDDIIIIPLATKACVGDMFLAFCGTYVESKAADLSRFGCDLTEWTHLRVESVNKHVTIFVNDAKAYELDFPHDPTGIVGVQYRFAGTGAIKDTWFRNGSGEFIPM